LGLPAVLRKTSQRVASAGYFCGQGEVDLFESGLLGELDQVPFVEVEHRIIIRDELLVEGL
jgi:hypothetical protein